MAERVAIFIDGSNLYHSLKNTFKKTNLDFEAFCKKLVGRRKLVRIYYYNAAVDQTKEKMRYQDQQRFFRQIARVPYLEVKLSRLIYHHGWPSVPPYEKGLDVQLATDMLVQCSRDNYDVAVLVSGDSDFAPAVQAVKDEGKHIEIVLIGPKGSSQSLRDKADKVVAVDAQLLTDCWK